MRKLTGIVLFLIVAVIFNTVYHEFLREPYLGFLKEYVVASPAIAQKIVKGDVNIKVLDYQNIGKASIEILTVRVGLDKYRIFTTMYGGLVVRLLEDDTSALYQHTKEHHGQRLR